MNTDSKQKSNQSENAVVLNTPLPIYTIEQFSIRNPAFTESALRNITFKASLRHSSIGEIKGNGLIECGALMRLGRKVLIHEPRFFEWLQNQQKGQADKC